MKSLTKEKQEMLNVGGIETADTEDIRLSENENKQEEGYPGVSEGMEVSLKNSRMIAKLAHELNVENPHELPAHLAEKFKGLNFYGSQERTTFIIQNILEQSDHPNNLPAFISGLLHEMSRTERGSGYGYYPPSDKNLNPSDLHAREEGREVGSYIFDMVKALQYKNGSIKEPFVQGFKELFGARSLNEARKALAAEKGIDLSNKRNSDLYPDFYKEYSKRAKELTPNDSIYQKAQKKTLDTLRLYSTIVFASLKRKFPNDRLGINDTARNALGVELEQLFEQKGLSIEGTLRGELPKEFITPKSELDSKVNELGKEVGSLQEELKKAQKSQEGATAEIARLKEQLTKRETELTEENRIISQQLEDLQKAIEEIFEDLENSQQKMGLIGGRKGVEWENIERLFREKGLIQG